MRWWRACATNTRYVPCLRADNNKNSLNNRRTANRVSESSEQRWWLPRSQQTTRDEWKHTARRLVVVCALCTTDRRSLRRVRLWQPNSSSCSLLACWGGSLLLVACLLYWLANRSSRDRAARVDLKLWAVCVRLKVLIDFAGFEGENFALHCWLLPVGSW